MDTRYTTTQQVVKLIGSHTISKVTVKIGDLKRTKMVRTINLYYNNRTVQAIVELKNKYGFLRLGEGSGPVRLNTVVGFGCGNQVKQHITRGFVCSLVYFSPAEGPGAILKEAHWDYFELCPMEPSGSKLCSSLKGS